MLDTDAMAKGAASSELGPDIVIVGAARSGTSYLSATLARHSHVDASAVKEPNYFSSKWDQGKAWYDAQFGPRSEGLLRLDSSVSYTYPQHPDALVRLRAASPKAKLIYAVRNPVPRLVSMYQLFHYYASPDAFANLAEAIEKSDMCLLSGDYGVWLGRLRELFAPEQILVMPFPLLTKGLSSGLDVLLPWLGLLPEPGLQGDGASSYRNEVREFRWKGLSKLQRVVHRSRVYPVLRSAIGPDRLRALRQVATHKASIPTVSEEVATLTTAQRQRLDEVSERATAAVTLWLQDQDLRLGTSWTQVWVDHLDEPLR